MAEAQSTAPRQGGDASLGSGAKKCPAKGLVTVVLKPFDKKKVEGSIKVRLVAKKGGEYARTASRGVAVFSAVAPGDYDATLELTDRSGYIVSGAPPSFAVAKSEKKTVEIAIRRRPWIGWRLKNVTTGITVGDAAFSVEVPTRSGGKETRSVAPNAKEGGVAKVDKMFGESASLKSVSTGEAVLVFDSLESA